jgi:hypothetical protein
MFRDAGVVNVIMQISSDAKLREGNARYRIIARIAARHPASDVFH